ncbi:hypothetical protein [Acidithiobacillus acidisediminis]|uniref:hypothetical protein n=1 Tax=Acidithiobacillus acidisediminis TaxID=2937799 RepID=UPI00200E606A|nr:hypothetical protein [Acidithiobacillus sp. S30A2]
MKNFKYILLVLFFTVPVLIHALLNTASLHGVGVMLAYVVLGVVILGALGVVFVLPMFGSYNPHRFPQKNESDSDKARRDNMVRMGQYDSWHRW